MYYLKFYYRSGDMVPAFLNTLDSHEMLLPGFQSHSFPLSWQTALSNPPDVRRSYLVERISCHADGRSIMTCEADKDVTNSGLSGWRAASATVTFVNFHFSAAS